MCSLTAGRKRPHSGQVYVAGLRFWALRSVHHLAGASRLSTTLASIASGRTEPVSSPPVEQRLKRVLAETARYRVIGSLRLPPDGYRSRLSDYLNAPDRAFLPLTSVELTPLDGGAPEQHQFLALSIQHIVFALPLDDESQ
jgi:hypothetical protein